RDHRVQQRAFRARHGPPRDLRAAERGRADSRVLPRPRADEGEARRHARQDLPAGGRAAVGLPLAPGRPRAGARAPHPALGPLARGGGGPPQDEGRRVSAAPLVEELVPAPDPLEASAGLADLGFLVLLDSAADPEHLGRHSFLAAGPFTAVRPKGALTQRLLDGRWPRVGEDPLEHTRLLLAPCAAEPVAGIPPFQGGAAGYLGYDWGAMLERSE